MVAFSITFICLGLGLATVGAVVQQPCTGGDCHPYWMAQGSCQEIISKPTNDCRWKSGLNPNVDLAVLNGTIFAYQIQFSNLQWSNWFAPGVNDIDPKIRANPASCFPTLDATAAGHTNLNRWWSYFFDHVHKYIICFNS